MKWIIVREQDGEWAAGLRRATTRDEAFGIAHAPTPDEVQRLLERHPASLVVWHTANHETPPLLAALPRLRQQFPTAVFVAATGDDNQAQSAYHEAGITLVVTRSWQLGPLIRLARKHFARQPTKAEATRETIWNVLPWQEHQLEIGWE